MSKNAKKPSKVSEKMGNHPIKSDYADGRLGTNVGSRSNQGVIAMAEIANRISHYAAHDAGYPQYVGIEHLSEQEIELLTNNTDKT